MGTRVSGGVRIVFKSVEMSSEVRNDNQGLTHVLEKCFGQSGLGRGWRCFSTDSGVACSPPTTGRGAAMPVSPEQEAP